MPENKIIMPSGVSLHKDVDDVVIVQHGLPGVEWKERIENEAMDLLGRERNYAAVFPSPSLTEPFSIDAYMRNLSEVVKDIGAYLRPSARVHLVGQSYGAAALLQTLRHMQKRGTKAPHSVHFLSPFVKIATAAQDPEIALSIMNTRLRTGQATLTQEEQEEILREVLEECRRVYKVKGDLVEEHRRLFGDAFYRAIGDLTEFVRDSRVQIIRGENDPYIGKEHTKLIRQKLGARVQERIVPKDGHDLSSVDIIKEILANRF